MIQTSPNANLGKRTPFYSKPRLRKTLHVKQNRQKRKIAGLPTHRCSLHGCFPPQLTVRRVKTQSVQICQATTADAAQVPEPKSSNPGLPLVKMGGYVFLWYAFNIVFNIYNKQALNAFQCPWFISSLQLAASCLFMAFLWVTGLQTRPKMSKDLFKALLPVALFHTIGHVSACVSFSKMAVSFAHIVKAAEPIFSVALSGPLLQETYPLTVWLSLVPIAFGCSLAAMKEISFTWGGFNSAMISNLGMVFRGIYSKKTLNDYKEMDGINLFGLISIVSLMYCLPLSIVVEGAQWGAGFKAAVNAVGMTKILTYLGISGLFYHLYNQASYMVLGLGIAPVTFSVGNTMKRVAVVISSILFFRHPVSMLNGVGSSIAILGTLLYSLAKGKQAEDQKKGKSAST